MTAMSVSKRVVEEMEMELRDLVVCAICFQDATGPNTIIMYMTYGVLRDRLKYADQERLEKEAEIRRVREQLLQENKERDPIA
ncbi:hypothetical protein Tco_0190822 [Tanacetum coccineum]